MDKYRMRYKHDDGTPAFFGEFTTEADAKGWWESMTTGPDAKAKPREWVLERRDGADWTIVSAHDAGGA